MATWYGRNSTGPGVWATGNQTKVSGPSLTIGGLIPTVTGVINTSSLAPTTMTASANINDSTGAAVPVGLNVVVMEDLCDAWSEVAEINVGLAGLVEFVNTQLPPHPNYIFVVPRQTNWAVETICTPPVTPI